MEDGGSDLGTIEAKNRGEGECLMLMEILDRWKLSVHILINYYK